MTTDRNKLLKLAKEELAVDGSLIYVLRDGINYYEINVTMAAGSREAAPRESLARDIAALLQAQGEPQSSDQVWNEVIEADIIRWIEKYRLDIPGAAYNALGEVILKRPLQAQDKIGCTRSHPHENMSEECQIKAIEAREVNRIRGEELRQQERNEPASVSGAVDVHHAFETRRAIMEAERNASADEYFKARHEMLDTIHNRRIFEAGFQRSWDKRDVAFSRAKAAQPAQQAQAVRTTEDRCIESYGSQDNTPIGALMNYQFNEIYELRALLSQPAAAPVRS